MNEIASCKQASRLISESLERPLTFTENLQLTVHLGLCHVCTQTQRQFKTLKNIFNHYAKLAGQLPPDGKTTLSPEARARIKTALK
jgi:hypothetical protein